MVKEVLEFLNKKSYSTVIVVFAVFWVLCHSQGFAAMLFTDQDLIFQKLGLLKNEYLQKYFFGNVCDYDFWIRALLPFILTWLYVWKIPKWIINRAYEKQINYKVDRDLIKERAQQRLIKERRQTTKEEVAVAKEQNKLVEENKKLEDNAPEKMWEREYEEFTKIENYKIVLAQLRYVIYENQGFIRHERISSESLMVCDTNGLINMSDGKCSITDKGKYFLKRNSNSGISN
ncbi:hypothetical protein IKF12_00825 [Candidatus Saccharibacteria bacterium]|nr:hypothetical protein [Candidatus Saccharibacteria bacterium]